MANRFWVGGTNSWDGTSGTKWATTSGGAGGATEPTGSDNAFFDANSGTGTITLDSSPSCTCLSLTTTGFTGTVAASSTSITLLIGGSTSGSLTIGSGTTWNFTGAILFESVSTNTLTTNGKIILGVIEIFLAGGSLTLQDNLTFDISGGFSTGLVCFSGTLNTNNKTIITGVFELGASSGDSTTLNLGSSLVNAIAFVMDDSGGGVVTINPGTSQITVDFDGGIFLAGTGTSISFYILNIGSATTVNGGVSLRCSTGTLVLAGANYLSLTGYITMDHTDGLTGITLTGALHFGGTPSLNIASDDGTKINFTANGTITPGTAANVADINALGSGSWNFSAAPVTMIDGGNNTGITFPLGGAIGTATGIATVSGIGHSTASSVASSAGTSTISGIGQGVHFSAGTASGSSAVSGVATATFSAIGTASGSSTVSGIGTAKIFSVGTAQGIAIVNGLSPIKMYAIGTAIGICLVQAQGNLNPQPLTPQPTEFSENVLIPLELAESIAAPIEYGESISNPTEYAA